MPAASLRLSRHVPRLRLGHTMHFKIVDAGVWFRATRDKRATATARRAKQEERPQPKPSGAWEPPDFVMALRRATQMTRFASGMSDIRHFYSL